MSASVDIRGVAKIFGGGEDAIHAFGPADLHIGDGEFVSLVGPSGCGKSTLMLILAGLLAPSQGEIRVDGRPVAGPRTDIGIMFQDNTLVPWRTVRGNVALQLELRGLDVGAYADRISSLLASVRLGGFETRYPYELSGGMQQRAAFCQAMVHEPDTLLLDEPLGKLDAMTRESIRADLQSLWMRKRPTVVFVTHSIEEAVQLSSRVCVITPRPGRIERVIDIDLPYPRDLDVKQAPEFVRHVREIQEIFHGYGVLLGGQSAACPPCRRRWARFALPTLQRQARRLTISANHHITGPAASVEEVERPRSRRISYAGLALRASRGWMFVAFFVGFFLFWEYSIDLFGIPRYILPKPSEIVTKSWADIDRLLYYTYVTGSESVIGYVIAVALAVPLGLAIAFSSVLRRTIYPFFVSLEMTPKIAFAPLFISWLGFGLLPKVIIVILVCFFPIVLNAILAFTSLGEELERFCRSTGASALRTFLKVRLPAAMPQCFVGFKYAAINATVGATIAEFIGSDQGLGFYIQITTGNMRPELAFAGIFLLTLLGLAMFGIVTLAERLAIPWHISVRRR